MKVKITEVNKDWMLTDFAMGYTVDYVHHKLMDMGVQVTNQAVNLWYQKWLKGGQLAERMQQIVKVLPLSDKGVRIKHLQQEFTELQKLKKAATAVDRLELIDKLLKILRQAAEEMGDIGKGGGGVHFYQDFRGNGKRPIPEHERVDLIRMLQGEAQRHTS